jgi:hypothetical protein
MRVYTFGTRNRFVAVLAALVVLGAGAALLLLGLALLAGVAVAGGVLGAGVLAYRALTGKRDAPLAEPPRRTLDPALEVFPEPGRADAGAEPNEDRRRIGPA